MKSLEESNLHPLTLRWLQLDRAPVSPGIYAWYYVPELASRDIEDVIGKLQSLSSGEPASERVLSDFLAERVTDYFREEPYQATVSGPLKPHYRGALTHEPASLATLLRRCAEDPDRIRVLGELLPRTAPLFASPLYIGMSQNLRRRLGQHRSLIEAYRADRRLDRREDHAGTSFGLSDREHSFAREIAKRRLPPSRLLVAVQQTTTEAASLDLETLLNRLYYPVFGRN